MFERFTNDARQAVVGAQEQARALNHNYIGTEHVLLGLTALPPAVGANRALHTLGLTYEGVRRQVVAIVGRGEAAPSGHIPFTPRCKKVLELSLREALNLQHDHIGPEHIVLGLLREGEGVAAKIISEQGLDFDQVRTAVLSEAPASGRSGRPAGDRTPATAQVIALAERIAAGAPIGSHHLLQAMIRTEGSMAAEALAAMGVDADVVTSRVDELDLTATTDVTPEQAAAARMRFELRGGAPAGEEGESHETMDPGTAEDAAVALVTTDPATIEQVRRILDQAGGQLGGDGPLAGPFVALHRALERACADLEAALSEPGPGEEVRAPANWGTSLRARLSRRRHAG